MEELQSRQNSRIRHFRELGRERDARRKAGEYLCDGWKLLEEALKAGAEITGVLWGGEPERELPPHVPQWRCSRELLQYASPLENSPGPLFTVSMPAADAGAAPRQALLLENVQDPGNVGTVLRTAAAFGAELVLLCGCADPYNPKTVRASMGAVFRQRFLELPFAEARERLRGWGLPLYAAALDETARDIRSLPLEQCAVAVGNEGKGLSRELLESADGRLIIPMSPGSESLNAAVAASVILWELCGRKQK